jgi:hypothetical protein
MKKKAILLLILSLFCISMFNGCNTKKSDNSQSKSESQISDEDKIPHLKEGEYKIVKKSNGEASLYVGNTISTPKDLLIEIFFGFEGNGVATKDISKILNDEQFQVFNEKLDTYIKSNYAILLENLNEDERKKFLDENIKQFKNMLNNNINIESYDVVDDNTVSFEVSVSGIDMKSRVDDISQSFSKSPQVYSNLSKSEKRQDILNDIVNSNYGTVNKQKITMILKANDGKWSIDYEDIDKIFNTFSSFNNKEEICNEIVKLLG